MSLSPGVVVMVVGAVMAAGSAVALATTPDARGGHAVAPAKLAAPLPPKQERRVPTVVTINGRPAKLGTQMPAARGGG